MHTALIFSCGALHPIPLSRSPTRQPQVPSSKQPSLYVTNIVCPPLLLLPWTATSNLLYSAGVHPQQCHKSHCASSSKSSQHHSKLTLAWGKRKDNHTYRFNFSPSSGLGANIWSNYWPCLTTKTSYRAVQIDSSFVQGHCNPNRLRANIWSEYSPCQPMKICQETPFLRFRVTTVLVNELRASIWLDTIQV